MDFRVKLQEWQDALKSAQGLAAQAHFPGTDKIATLLALIAKQLAVRDTYEFLEALNKARDRWLDAGEDFTDVNGFYSNQLAPWHKLLAAATRFSANRDALAGDATASAALKEMLAIREDPAPYARISRIDPLIASIEASNDVLVQGAREAAIDSVDKKVAEVTQALSHTSADADLSNAALYPLQQCKLKIGESASIPDISYLALGAEQLFDEAIERIIESMRQQAAKDDTATTGKGDGGKATTHVPKSSQSVRPSELATRPYLESEAEVEAYIEELRETFQAILKSGKRIRIL